MPENQPKKDSRRWLGIDVVYYLKNGGFLFLDYAAKGAVSDEFDSLIGLGEASADGGEKDKDAGSALPE